MAIIYQEQIIKELRIKYNYLPRFKNDFELILVRTPLSARKIKFGLSYWDNETIKNKIKISNYGDPEIFIDFFYPLSENLTIIKFERGDSNGTMETTN